MRKRLIKRWEDVNGHYAYFLHRTKDGFVVSSKVMENGKWVPHTTVTIKKFYAAARFFMEQIQDHELASRNFKWKIVEKGW